MQFGPLTESGHRCTPDRQFLAIASSCLAGAGGVDGGAPSRSPVQPGGSLAGKLSRDASSTSSCTCWVRSSVAFVSSNENIIKTQ